MAPAKQAKQVVEELGQKIIQLELLPGKDKIASKQGITVFENIQENVTYNQEYSSPDTGIVLGVKDTQQEPTYCKDFVIGKLKCKRLLVCARCKLFWMTPEWTQYPQGIPPDTQFMLVELQDEDCYAIILPLIDNAFRCTLRPSNGRGLFNNGTNNGAIRSKYDLILRVDSGDKTVKGNTFSRALFVGAGRDPFELVERGMSAAAYLSGGAKPLKEKALPDTLDYFGWCTWDAFYSTVSAQGVIEGLNTLKEGGTPPKFIIIDDGWQQTELDEYLQAAPTRKLQMKENFNKFVRDTIEQDLNETLLETEDELVEAEVEIYQEMGKYIPPSSQAGVALEAVHGGSHPSLHPPIPKHEHKHKEGTAETAVFTEERVVWWVGLFQKTVGFMIGLLNALVLLLYRVFVETGEHDSFAVKLFMYIANGPCKEGMLQFYATTNDFTRRVISIYENGKFSHINAGPKDWYTVGGSFAQVISHIKEKLGVTHVYCWHGLPVYWAGIMPSEQMQKYNPRIEYPQPTESLLELEPSMGWYPIVLAGIGVVDNLGQLYDDLHRYLRSQGVDGVKVDIQAGVGLTGTIMGGGASFGASMHNILETSAQKHFPGNHIINCMCHSTENIYRMTNSAIARACDDFYPRDPASNTPHIANSAFNSLFLSALVQPDWDMFHSKHPASEMHGMARAISGGAVYVSDKPGEHDFELLKRLVLPDGSVLRTKVPARPTKDSLFNDVMRDETSALKVWSLNNCSGVVAAFNVQGSSWDRTRRMFHIHQKKPKELTCSVGVKDVNDVPKAPCGNGRFVVFQYGNDRIQRLGLNGSVEAILNGAESHLFTVVQESECQGVRFAPIGLIDMYNTGGAVLSWTLEESSENKLLDGFRDKTISLLHRVGVRGCGRFALACSHRPRHIKLKDENELDFEFNVDKQVAYFELPNNVEKCSKMRELEVTF